MSFLFVCLFVCGSKKHTSATPLHCSWILRAKNSPIASVHLVLKEGVSCSIFASLCEGRPSDFVLSAVEAEGRSSSLTGRNASVVF